MNYIEYLGLFREIEAEAIDRDLALAVFHEVNNDRRQEEIRLAKSRRQPATPRQIELLKNYGVDVDPDWTKAEASRKIDEVMGKR